LPRSKRSRAETRSLVFVARLTELRVNMLALKKARLTIGDQRLGPFGQPLVGLDALAPPLRLTAVPVARSDAGKRHRQRPEGADELAWPVAVAIALGRAPLR
jgi:hypothetical protein